MQKRPLRLTMMMLAVCFTLLLQGTICASLPVEKPSQNFNSWMGFLFGGSTNTFEEVQDEHTTDHLKKKEMPESYSTEISSLNEMAENRSDVVRVAFHAYINSSHCYGNHQTIKFDKATVDVGSHHGLGFNIHTGTFIVPEPGVYAFTWTMAADYGTRFTSQLMVDSDVQGEIMSDSDVVGQVAHGIHPATGFVLAEVKTGQMVYIRFKKQGGCNVMSGQFTRSTFSGWLLH